MGINLGGGYGFVAHHHLYGTQIGTSFQQCRSKRMSKGMGRDGFLNTGSHSLALDHDEYHGSGEMRPTSVEEHIIFLAGLDIHLPTVGKPKFNFVEGFLRDGYETLFRSFAHHSDVALLYEEVAELECDEFADTQSAGKERFDNRPIALPLVRSMLALSISTSRVESTSGR